MAYIFQASISTSGIEWAVTMLDPTDNRNKTDVVSKSWYKGIFGNTFLPSILYNKAIMCADKTSPIKYLTNTSSIDNNVLLYKYTSAILD